MKALLLESPRNFREIELDHPADPGPGEALVRVHRIGICGTDISGYLGKMPFFSYPRIPGHELGVEVVAVGEGVTNVKAGDHCSVEPYINDPESYASRHGHPNCCERLEVLGVHRDGGMRSHFLLPARKLHPSTILALEQLALVETLAIGCHAVNRAAEGRADHSEEFWLVIGAGPIGLATLEFVKLTGAKAIVLDVNEQRLDFCKNVMGIPQTLTLNDDVIKNLREVTDGHLPEVVIDATGSSVSMSNAFGYTAPGGRLVYVGITTDEVRFKHPVFHKTEGTLLCSRNALPDDFRRIIGLIENGQIDTDPWITHRASLADLPGLFTSYTKPETGVIKAVISVD